MPSPKPVRAAALPTPANTSASIELDSISGSSSSSGTSGRLRRHSLLNGAVPGSVGTAGIVTGDRRTQPTRDSDEGWDDWGDEEGKDKSRRNPSRPSQDDSLFEDDYGAGLDAEVGFGLEDRERRQRLVGGGFEFGEPDSPMLVAVTEDERKEADKHVLRRLVINGSLIGLWYLFSLSISLYNKWMFGSNFPFPLFTTSIHMLVQFLLSCLVLYFMPSLRPAAAMAKAEAAARAAGDDYYKPAGMSKWFYLTRIGPCGAATGLDIGLGNASLKLITLTFYTMCKSSSLAFVLLFAFAFRLEKPTLRLVAIIATMTVGVVMMVAGEVEFDSFGFFLVITAAFFSGFRWGLTQMMLLRNPATSNPFSSIFFLAPVMFVTLFVLAIPMEGFSELIQGFRVLEGQFGPLRTPLLILFPGTIAFLMTASEFALLQRTSVVTLSIAGIFKEVVTITTATLVFHDTLTPVNLLGLLVTMAAIVVYNYIKITKMRQQAQIDVHKEHLETRGQHSDGHEQRRDGSPQGNGRGDTDDRDDREDAGLLPRQER